jgi:chromosome segregation ATPase
MPTDNNKQEVPVEPKSAEGEGTPKAETTDLASLRSEMSKLSETIGSLKRENKDYKKELEELRSTKDTNKPKQDDLLVQKLEKMSLRQAGITHADDIELAKATAKKWGMDIDDVLADEDFKVKLERQQTTRSNAQATSDIKGGGGQSQTKLSAAYWEKTGKPPSREDVPDRKARVKIHREMMKNAATSGKVFYND